MRRSSIAVVRCTTTDTSGPTAARCDAELLAHMEPGERPVVAKFLAGLVSAVGIHE